jgi:hypothetical protein
MRLPGASGGEGAKSVSENWLFNRLPVQVGKLATPEKARPKNVLGLRFHRASPKPLGNVEPQAEFSISQTLDS